jgi:predicted nucleotidyltransferase
VEKDLNELVSKLRQAAGANLKSVVLYGSAVAGDFHARHSNLNVLCLLERLDAAELERLAPAAEWWERRGNPAPLLFTLEELKRSADVFAIELLDIQSAYRVLEGEDWVAGLEVPMRLHRLQVERELRQALVRLRERYLAGARDARSVLHLMTASISTFAVLFRHALIALDAAQSERSGVSNPKRAAIRGLAERLHFDPAPFETVLEVREGKRQAKDVPFEATFRGYLEGITKVVDEVDRRLASEAH